MSESEDIVDDVDPIQKPSVDLDSLVISACKSLELIEPWQTAVAKHKDVIPYIDSVKEQSQVYYEALDMSLLAAQNGIVFSQDAEALCDCLLNPHCPVDDIIVFVQDMRELATRSHGEAKTMCDKFRSVRQNLIQITSGVPTTVAKLTADKQKADDSAKRADSIAQKAKISRNVAGGAAVVVGALVTTGALVFPPALVILPVVLPILAFITGVIQEGFQMRAANRRKESVSCADGMKQLRKVTQDLSELADCVDLFADWWIEMDTMLSTVEAKVSLLEPGKIGRLRMITVKRNWNDVKDKYLHYKQKVMKLQDFYPSSIQQSPQFLL